MIRSSSWRIFRYTLREIITTLFAVTGLLLAIFISNLFVRYLASAAGGTLPITLIGKLMLLTIPQLLGLLLPMGLFFAILLALGRMNADSEMTVLSACGFSTWALCRLVIILGVVVAIIVGVMNLVLGPSISIERQRMLRQTGTANIVDVIAPGRFQKIGNNNNVIYVEEVDHDTNSVGKLFVAEKLPQSAGGQWRIVAAQHGRVVPSKDNLGRDFVAQDGQMVQGRSGQNAFQIMKFSEYGMRLQYDAVNLSSNEKTLPTMQLWENPQHKASYRAELQWRISISIMAIVLALLAVPLSRAEPRQGKFARMLPGTVIIIVYANLIIVMRDWISENKLPYWFNMGWLHLFMILFAIALILWPERKRLSLFKEKSV